MQKSIFQSKTFWGAALTLTVAVAPKAAEMAKDGKLTIDNTLPIVMILGTTGLTIVGRIDADTPVYTPDWAPGPNKDDLKDGENGSRN